MDSVVGLFVKIFEEVWYPKWPPLSTEHKVVEAVKDGSFFGLVRCDVRVPPELMEHFSEMTPLFGHAKLGEAHLSPHMREFVVLSVTSVSTHPCTCQQGRGYALRLRALAVLSKERFGCS